MSNNPKSCLNESFSKSIGMILITALGVLVLIVVIFLMNICFMKRKIKLMPDRDFFHEDPENNRKLRISRLYAVPFDQYHGGIEKQTYDEVFESDLNMKTDPLNFNQLMEDKTDAENMNLFDYDETRDEFDESMKAYIKIFRTRQGDPGTTSRTVQIQLTEDDDDEKTQDSTQYVVSKAESGGVISNILNE